MGFTYYFAKAIKIALIITGLTNLSVILFYSLLVGFFEADSVRIFIVGPNAETIYFQRDEEDRPDGGLQVSGDQATFRFKGEDPQDIKFGEHEGAYYPESVLPSPFELEGFRWLPQNRPDKARLLYSERILRGLAQPVGAGVAVQEEGKDDADDTNGAPASEQQ